MKYTHRSKIELVKFGLVLGVIFEIISPKTKIITVLFAIILGYIIGSKRDEVVSAQINEKEYRVKEISGNDITIEDKFGNKQVITVTDKKMKSEKFEINDIVFLDASNSIEQAYIKK